ncbi:MAG: BatA domain-containing protein, partial [Alphaproteobacteria bacterium]|nr:BatA domain-containing protein [Alphaproteobacteria bacterium]
MSFFAAFAFLSPWWLLVLSGLPVLWWLLRVTPPAPRRAAFPAIALLLRLKPKEETPAQTPWWLLLLRLLIAALIILALAQPVINPAARLGAGGPVMIVIDDNWASAANWAGRRNVIDQILDRAEREARAVTVLSTSPNLSGEAPRLSRLATAQETRSLLGALEPKPWQADRAAALAALDTNAPAQAAAIYYLGDGLEDPNTNPLVERLQCIGPVTYIADPPER